LERTKTKQLEELKKGLKTQFNALLSDIDKESLAMDLTLKAYRSQFLELSKDLEASKGKYGNLKQVAADFEKDKTRMEISLKASSTSFNDFYLKERTELDKRALVYSQEADSLKAKITDLKSQFGDASKLMDKMSSAKNDIQEITKQIDESKADVNKMLAEVKSLPTLTNLTPEQKADIVETLSEDAKTSSKKVTRAKDYIRRTAQRLNDVGEDSE
jgi:chromosome segregation ATPase